MHCWHLATDLKKLGEQCELYWPQIESGEACWPKVEVLFEGVVKIHELKNQIVKAEAKLVQYTLNIPERSSTE